MRHLLSTESGANDGLVFAFFFALLMMRKPPADALVEWFTFVVLWQVLGGMMVAALIGYGAGRFLQWAEGKDTIREAPYFVYSTALALFVLGFTRLMNTGGIFAVFAAGTAFSLAISAETQTAQDSIMDAIDRFFILPIFALLGLTLPWSDWIDLGWKAPALAAVVLLFRRLPAVLALTPCWSEREDSRDRGKAYFMAGSIL